VVVDNSWVAALLLDDSPEALEAVARGDGGAGLARAVAGVDSDTTEDQHARRQLDGDVDQIRRAPALQHIEAFDHFEGVANRAAEWRVHAGDDGFGAHARRGANRDE
jgi:hypothetical protein